MSSVTQLFNGVYLLQGVVGGRPLTLTLLVGEEKSLLFDTGCASDVEALILPALKEVGLNAAKLSLLITSHCDLDHVGGNHGMKKAAPRAILCCGDADRDQVESPDRLFSQRYDAFREAHGLYYDEEVRGWILSESGAPQPVELTFRGGERLRLSADWEVEILHLPGHSRGHLGILDRRHRALYGADAIHGAVMMTTEGHPAMPPTYLYVDAYLHTIRQIENFDIDTYVGCHWPMMDSRDEIRSFCDETRNYVEQTERLIITALQQAPSGMTLSDLCQEVGPRLGSWPNEVNREHTYVFSGHLRQLTGQGRVRVKASVPNRFEMVQP